MCAACLSVTAFHTSADQGQAHSDCASLSTFQVPLGHAKKGLPDPPQEQRGRTLGAEANVRVRCRSKRTTWSYKYVSFVSELSGLRFPTMEL